MIDDAADVVNSGPVGRLNLSKEKKTKEKRLGNQHNQKSFANSVKEKKATSRSPMQTNEADETQKSPTKKHIANHHFFNSVPNPVDTKSNHSPPKKRKK